ncbi:MAG TPA: hypothetical protein VET88_01915, partial [Gammaproteobacteria bacterium]|nr:hypothetical protein [Gammaproteobacteria bacterium]
MQRRIHGTRQRVDSPRKRTRRTLRLRIPAAATGVGKHPATVTPPTRPFSDGKVRPKSAASLSEYFIFAQYFSQLQEKSGTVKTRQDNRIRSSAIVQLLVIWGFALIWNLFNIPLLLKAPDILSEKHAVALLVFLFPLAGAGLLLLALARTRQWLRFGVARLTLQPFPGRTGEPVSGHIDIRLPWSSTIRAALAMSCMHAYSERSGSGHRSRRVVKWQDQEIVPLVAAQQGSRVNFRFTPPGGLPASGAAGNGRYYWTLDVNIVLPGADFSRQYEIPMHAGTTRPGAEGEDVSGKHPVGYAADTSSASAANEAPRGSEELLGRVLKFGYSSGGRLFSYLPFRSLKLSLLLTAMGMVFSAAGSYLYSKQAAPLPFALVFILSGLALFISGMVSFGHRRDVTISSDRIRITNSYFGLTRTTQVAASDISDISKRIGHQTSGAAGQRAAYS